MTERYTTSDSDANAELDTNWAHALAAPIAALGVLLKSASRLDAEQRALLVATLARLEALQKKAVYLDSRCSAANALHVPPPSKESRE